MDILRLEPETKIETKCGMAENVSEYSNPGLRKMLKKFSTVFREKLTPGLPPEIVIDYENETDKDAKSPLKPV